MIISEVLKTRKAVGMLGELECSPGAQMHYLFTARYFYSVALRILALLEIRVKTTEVGL